MNNFRTPFASMHLNTFPLHSECVSMYDNGGGGDGGGGGCGPGIFTPSSAVVSTYPPTHLGDTLLRNKSVIIENLIKLSTFQQ